MKENKVSTYMGEHCSIMDRKIPLYANLIKIGNNVHNALKVDFIPHDITHVILNGMTLYMLLGEIVRKLKPKQIHT